MSEKQKWSSENIITFLNIYKKYDCLWDFASHGFLKRDVKQSEFEMLRSELEEAGLPTNEELLKKKIKSIRDAYRNEVNKVKKSQRGGKQDNYKPKLVWFQVADSFWRNAISGRQSLSNLVRSCLHVTLLLKLTNVI